MKNVFVPLDGSELAEHAVAPALALAERWNGRVHLASIVLEPEPVPILSPGSGLLEHPADAGENRATEYLSGLAGRVDVPQGVQLVTHVRRGTAAPKLIELMEEVGADLLFLTTHGRGALGRFWLGSVADELVRSAGCPAISIRPREGRQSFESPAFPQTVLVALDGSEAAEQVLGPLMAILPAGARRVILAAAVEQPLPFSSPYLPEQPSVGEIMRQRQDWLSDYLDKLSERLRREGVESVGREVVVDSAAASALLRIAELEKPDMIALATHGRGGASRLFLGSVADKLIRAADVPVLTVPIGDG